MNALRSTTRSLVAVLGFAASLATVTGCSAKPVEGTGSSSSKLLAPHAMFKGAASAETKRLLGISEWRIYQGKTKYVVTGFSAAGKAVKGVSIAFSGASESSNALLQARLLDGTHFSATHAFGGSTTASTSMKPLSQSFVTQAVHDLTALRMGLKTSITKSAVHTGEACSGDLVKIAMTSIQCIATASASGSSVSKQIKIKQCVAAAESASNAVESCKNAGTSTTDTAADKATTPAKSTTADKTTANKTSSGTSSTDQAAADKKQDAQQDAADDKQAAADKKQDAEQDAADAKLEEADKKQDAEQDAADDKQAAADQKQDAEQDAADAKADAAAGADATTASEGQTCSSCEGTGASDVKADDTTGEVQQADASADTGGGDTGGDTGGGDTSGGGETTDA